MGPHSFKAPARDPGCLIRDTYGVNFFPAVVKAIGLVGMVKAGLLELQVSDGVVLRGRDLQVVEEGQVLVLPGVTDSKPEVSGGRGQRPDVDAQGQ